MLTLREKRNGLVVVGKEFELFLCYFYDTIEDIGTKLFELLLVLLLDD